MSGGRLSGASVLVTRPRSQAAELVAAILREGGAAHCFPVLDIEGRDREVLKREQASLPAADIAVFVSVNAVRHGLDLFPDGVTLAAIGPTTRAAIEAAGRTVDICPHHGFDSEHLLREPGLGSVAGRTIRIVRADSGRELLAETLRDRGARVDYLSVYRRLPRRVSDAELAELERRWRSRAPDFVTVMSVATLDALLSLLPDPCRGALPATPLVTPSDRVIQTARERIPGARTILAPGPQAEEMVGAMAAALPKTK